KPRNNGLFGPNARAKCVNFARVLWGPQSERKISMVLQTRRPYPPSPLHALHRGRFHSSRRCRQTRQVRGSKMAHPVQFDHLALTRRELLHRCGMGFGALALGNLVVGAQKASAASTDPLAPKSPHFAPRATRV